MSRIVAALLAVGLGADALVQLFAPYWWYGVVPGVTATGPFNPHFVRDVGAAYLVVAGALAAYAWRPAEARPAVAAAAAFLILHAAVHVFDAACGPHPLRDVVRDLGAIYLTALVVLWIALARRPSSKETTHAESHPRPSDRPLRAPLGL